MCRRNVWALTKNASSILGIFSLGPLAFITPCDRLLGLGSNFLCRNSDSPGPLKMSTSHVKLLVCNFPKLCRTHWYGVSIPSWSSLHVLFLSLDSPLSFLKLYPNTHFCCLIHTISFSYTLWLYNYQHFLQDASAPDLHPPLFFQSPL